MQDFTYHCHTNSLKIFDGRNSADQMITRAEELGFKEIGISNHLICHPCISEVDKVQAMFFREYHQVEDIYKRNIEDIHNAAAKHKIKVWVGFEVDYFNDPEWLRFFEKLRSKLEVDYYIGSSHLIYSTDYKTILKIKYLNTRPDLLNDDIVQNGLRNHWKNIISSVKSGYFTFMAHIDQIRDKGFCISSEWDELKIELIETLAKYKTPYELSTKGLRKGNDFYPSRWFVEQLCQRQVPVLISDDAHTIQDLGDNFALAESLLDSLKYPVRFHL